MLEADSLMKVTIAEIRDGVRNLSLSGHPLCVHSSLRSFGRVEGGAQAVVDALLAEGCTVMVPSFFWGFAVPPPPHSRPARKGWDYARFEGPTAGVGRVYTPECTEIDADMGAIPAAVVTMPGRARGGHPLCSFAAVGPVARALVAEQGPLHVYAPLRALAARNGWVVLMGVGLDKMTLIHLAEQMAGRNPFRRWANGPDGRAIEVEVGGCSDGFGNLEPALSAFIRERKVGESMWLVLPARDALEAAAAAIRQNPEVTHCGDPDCDRCNDAVLGGPVVGAGVDG